MNKILVTGAAGFIGNAFCRRLLSEGFFVVGIDSINEYYDINLKKERLKLILDHDHFEFERINIVDKEKIENIFLKHKFDYVVHLAAQAGVRYSITNPEDYTNSNLVGFFNILEAVRKHKDTIKHFIFASSSSVYGNLKNVPFEEEDIENKPISYYAATKMANENMAHSYSHLYNIPTTGLRFFTVYGPWGRPDMALFGFTEKILNNKSIDVFNNGNCLRDFTYIDDTIECMLRLLDKSNRYQILNLGNSSPIKLDKFVSILENKLQKTAEKKFIESQAGDVDMTYADCTKLKNLINFTPNTNIEEGIEKFVHWYIQYYDIR